MQPESNALITPIHLKTRTDAPLPDDHPVYLVLANNGLWICRNHEFFTSSVRTRSWPAELDSHTTSLELYHPKIPMKVMERTIGFFAAVAARFGSEAGVLLAWDRIRKKMRLMVPKQVATVGVSWNDSVYPIGLHYEIPSDLPPNWSIIGDIHSHVYGSAYASGQDQSDEEYRSGVHFVVGKIDREPPDFHAEYVVDGARFKIDPNSVLEGYDSRNSNVPERWMRKVTVKDLSWSNRTV